MSNFINVNYNEMSRAKNLGYQSISLSADSGPDMEFESKDRNFAKD